MNKRFLVLALLMAGLAVVAPMAYASDSDPDNAAGIDVHDNEVVESLIVGVSDTSSGNTIQVGPIGGVFEGAVSVEQASGTTTQVYTGACALEAVNLVAESAGDYIEIYDGTSRGDYTDCILDIQEATADDSKCVDWCVEMTTGIYAYMSGGVAQIRYRIEDQSE